MGAGGRQGEHGSMHGSGGGRRRSRGIGGTNLCWELLRVALQPPRAWSCLYVCSWRDCDALHARWR